MTTAQLKETPLATCHRGLGARMVDFAGWNMPVQYKSIIAEHMATRKNAGLFDVSHMGEFIVSGNGAFDFIQYVIGNDLVRLAKPNCALYTQLIMPDGGVVDDLIVYRRTNDYLLVVNASNIEKDWQWINQYKNKFQDVQLKDISDQTALLALQGPKACAIFKQLAGDFIEQMPSFSYAESTIDGIPVSFGRTGYTGEDGFEIFVSTSDAAKLWNTLLETGKSYGIEPCGLGARDTLRLESAYPLYGHELSDSISPLEAGLGWSVKLDKSDFVGRDALIRQKAAGLKKTCVCLKVEGKALPRQGYTVLKDGKRIGEVTSGSQGIFVGYPIAMAFVPSEHATTGNVLQVAIRDANANATIVARPFYKRSK